MFTHSLFQGKICMGKMQGGWFMNLKILEDMSMDVDEIQIQYHPDNEAEVKKLKEFLEFQTQVLEVVDENNQVKKIRYAMIYSLCLENRKVKIYGYNKVYSVSELFEHLKEKFVGECFALINDHTIINAYHTKRILQGEPIQIILENQQALTCTNLLELNKLIEKE